MLIGDSKFSKFILYPLVVDCRDWELMMSEPVSHFIGDWTVVGLLEIW